MYDIYFALAFNILGNFIIENNNDVWKELSGIKIHVKGAYTRWMGPGRFNHIMRFSYC